MVSEPNERVHLLLISIFLYNDIYKKSFLRPRKLTSPVTVTELYSSIYFCLQKPHTPVIWAPVWIKRSSLYHWPVSPSSCHLLRDCVGLSPPQAGSDSTADPRLAPRDGVGHDTCAPSSSPGARFVIAWTIPMTPPTLAFLGVPHPTVATHRSLWTPKSLRGLREARLVHIVTLQEWVLTSSCACLKSTWRKAEVQRWERAAESQSSQGKLLAQREHLFSDYKSHECSL